MLLGAIEGGGTKMVLGLGDEQGTILERRTLKTRTPEQTMPEMIDFFRGRGIAALGVGNLGPLDLHPASPTYGYITATPKLAWQNYPLLAGLERALCVPCALDTDVNAAALAECRLGAGRGVGTLLYVTVGTGVGGGLLCQGRVQHGLLHPEWGHIPLPRHPEDPLPRGVCPFHENCLEGLAAGPSLKARWGVPGDQLPSDHPAWRIEAYYLAQLCVTALMTVSAERVILGGGVMNQPQLFPLVRAQCRRLLGGYLAHPRLEDLDALIVPPALAPDSGLIGGLLLAADRMAAR